MSLPAKAIVIFLIFVISCFIAFLIWMNLTPGYFHEPCSCCQQNTYVVYERKCKIDCSVSILCIPQNDYSLFNKILLYCSAFDNYE